jgi:FkbM family methyltransferase
MFDRTKRFRNEVQLAQLKRRMSTADPGTVVPCLKYQVRMNDGPNFYILYKDIFVNRIYHFEAQRPNPLILDCGSNIGMSILYFKHVYPGARIIGFEPDPEIFAYLEENVRLNDLKDVSLIQGALTKHDDAVEFYSDGKYGSGLWKCLAATSHKGWKKYHVCNVRLRDYLKESVDFLKMNIEGAEHEVLLDSESCLKQVKEMVVEYHHLPGLPRTLHEILGILHRQGFEYLIHDFDIETNAEVKPPFSLSPQSRYFLLIYARRLD